MCHILKKAKGPMEAPALKSILISRLRFIGDVVLTTPVIKALKQHYPNASICYLTEATPASVLANNPHLEEVIIFPSEFLTGLSILTKCKKQLRFIQSLRKRQFDLTIDLFGNPRSALLTWAMGSRYRVGYDVRGRGRAYNIKIKRSKSLRVVDAYLDAVRTIGVPADDDRTEVYFSAKDVKWAENWLDKNNRRGAQPLIALNPGASWPAKAWGAEQFVELAKGLIKSVNATVLLITEPGKQEAIARICNQLGCAGSIVETDSLTHLAALISSCDLYVSNDCGPMHISAAVGTPTIGLFGPSCPEIWFPYSEKYGHKALHAETDACCGRDFCIQPTPCIESISSRKVLDTAVSLLERFS